MVTLMAIWAKVLSGVVGSEVYLKHQDKKKGSLKVKDLKMGQAYLFLPV